MFVRIVAQLASASPPQGGESQEDRQNNFLAVFLNSANIALSRNPIFSTRRRVSIALICDKLARASRPSTAPTETRSVCTRGEVGRGTIKHASGPKPRIMRTGRRNNSSLPSCSEPMFTPRRHHHISRTVYKRGCSAFVSFFFSFHLSKSFFIWYTLITRASASLRKGQTIESYNSGFGLVPVPPCGTGTNLSIV